MDKLFVRSLLLLLFACGSWDVLGQANRPAPGQSSVLVSAEGKVELSPAGTTAWSVAKTNQSLKFGDRLRTGEKSRAIVRLSDLSLLRINELTTVEIQPPPQAGGKATLDLKAGAAYFFSREGTREMNIRTPVASGAIRGTEFNLEVSEDGMTVMTLIEGEVDLSNNQGSIALKTGEQGTVESSSKAPIRTAVLDTINIIQWALYYPGVLDPDEAGLNDNEQKALANSLNAYRQGNLLGALEQYPSGRTPGSAAERVYQAALFLSVGQAEQAQKVLKSGNVDSRLAQALELVIASVKNQPVTLAGEPTSASGWLAQSYYWQSRSELDKAREAARRAVQKSPRFGFALARLAEMEFSFGQTETALGHLEKSLEAAPANAQALSLKGFLLSAQGRFHEALDYFNRAIAADGSLGNGWLGRGLVRIRQGQGQAGREDLQVAAALEPNRSVLRSYLGKAYSHVGDGSRARKELDLARKLDPADPTSWLYSALLHQQQNRINEAVSDLEKSRELNENRSVYRSRLLLDQDQAVRSANLAAIYRDAGMVDVSVREATRAVSYDYANYSAHLFLANSYNELRDPRQINLRYETPWFNELLLANLLAPVGAGNLSQNVSQQEYSRFFAGDHLGFLSKTEYYSSGDWTQSGSVYGTFGKTSFALDAFYRDDNGQRPNNDLEQLTLAASFKQQITAKDSIFFQAIYYDSESGDLSQYYRQNNFARGLRVEERQEPILLGGYHREWSPGNHTLILAGRLIDDLGYNNSQQPLLLLARNPAGAIFGIPVPNLPVAPLAYDSDLEIYTAELQQILQRASHTVIFGGRYQVGDFDSRNRLGASSATQIGNTTTTSVLAFASAPINQSFSSDFERFSLYAYDHWQALDSLLISAGVTYDNLKFPDNYRVPPIGGREERNDRVSPKFGLTWTPTKSTVVRGAYTRSLGGVSYDQSVRLEPSQIAGFNSSFRSLISESVAGSLANAEFETFGLAVEQKLAKKTYFGIEAEVLRSDVDRTIGVFNLTFPPATTPSAINQKLDYEEHNLVITLNQLISKEWALGARYRYSHSELESRYPAIPATVSSAFKTENTAIIHQLHLYALYNLPCGFFARGESVWTQQSNRDYTPDLPGDDFWQFNAYLGYRFPKRRAEVRVGLLNITDQDYRLNPLNLHTELPRERTFYASLKISF